MRRANVVPGLVLNSTKNPDLLGTQHLSLCEEHFTAEQFMNPAEKGIL